MYFAIAVILFYGISIAMLVAASTLKRSHSDYELKGFLRSYAHLDEVRRSNEKQRVRAALQRSNLLNQKTCTTIDGSSVIASVHRAVDAAIRRPSFVAGKPLDHNEDEDKPTACSTVWIEQQPTVRVIVSPAESEKAAGSDATFGYRLLRQTVAVGPSDAGNGAELNRKPCDGGGDRATRLPATRLMTAISSGDVVEVGGSRVWPANELTVGCVDPLDHRRRRRRRWEQSPRSWWSWSRPVSDSRLSLPLTERSLLTGRTTLSSMSHLSHLLGLTSDWNRDGRRNTAV